MKHLLPALCAGALSCAHIGPAPGGPEGAARSYADALEQGRLEAAFGLSIGLDEAHFKEAYADPAVRARRVSAVRAAADGTDSGQALKLVQEGGAWRVQELELAKPAVQEQAGEALARFLDAADAGDFGAALALTGSTWRAKYTADRFKDDFGREPLAKDRLLRARAALAKGGWIVGADGAQLPIADGRAVRLVREADGYKVVALE